MEGNSLDKIKASQIQEIKAPGTFEELLQALQFYLGITTILFGPHSALVTGTKLITAAIESKKIVFKMRIAPDSKFSTNLLYAMEICTRHWLGECQKYSDRLMVNDRLICFDEVLEMVLNSSLNVILSPNFIKPSPKKPTPKLTSMPGDDGKQKNKKRKSNKVGGERAIKNTTPITEFLMKDNEVWERNFAGKCTRDCSKWDNNTFMCAHWYIRSKCCCNCNNKASHIGACAIPSTNCNKFKTFLGNVCQENMSPHSA
jgi:hypothetical protein